MSQKKHHIGIINKVKTYNMYLSFIKTVIALLNSMIGGAIIILPIKFVENGWVVSLGVLVITAICICYSNIIVMDHMHENETTITEAISRHEKTKNNFPWYTLVITISCQLMFYTYFNLIMKQWRGLFFKQIWCFEYLPYFTLLSLVIWTLLIKKVHLGIGLMAFGAISVVIGIFFISWMFATRPQPHINQFPAIANNSIADLISLLIGSFSIQNVYIEILKSHPFPKQKSLIICVTYGLGALAYTYVGIIGGFGILDRIPVISNAQVLMGYFYADKWQPFVLQLVFIIHLYTVWPEWVSTNAIRIAELLEIQPQQWKINIYVVISTFIGFLLYQMDVNLMTFANLNGGVCLFFSIFAIPIAVHIKCRYFHQQKQMIQCDQQLYSKWIEDDEKCNLQRMNQTSIGKAVDISILCLMSIYGTATLCICLNQTVFKKLIG